MARSDSPLEGRMIFLVGARRSGTNWLQRIVNAHPDVVGVPSETYLFSRALAPLTEHFQHGAAGSYSLGVIYMERAAFLDALREFCDATFMGLIETLDPNAARLTERTPEHSTCLDLIGDVYPDAHVVHIIRDGRDVVRSLASQHWGPGSIRAAAGEWRTSVERARKESARLRHYTEIRYEELLADPRSQIARLYECLDLPCDDAILDAAVIEADVPFNVDPGFATVGVGKWESRFSPADIAEFEAVAGPLLAELGYEAPPPGGTPAHLSPAAAEATADEADPAPAPRRSLLRRLAGRLLRRPGPDFAQLTHDAIFGTQALADQFLGAVAVRRFEDLGALFTPSAHIRIVGEDEVWQGRGAAALQRLTETLATDPVLEGRQVRGDVHPAPGLFTVIAAYSTEQETAERTFVIGAENGRISRLVYYRYPSRDLAQRRG
jgi:hypothetical protein